MNRPDDDLEGKSILDLAEDMLLLLEEHERLSRPAPVPTPQPETE